MYSCERCDRTFKDLSNYKKHKENRSTLCRRPTHKCNYCNKNFSSYQSLWKHKNKNRCTEKDQQKMEIPTFSGSEFDGTGKPKSKETMNKLRRLIHQRDESSKKVARYDEPKKQVDLLNTSNKKQKKSKEKEFNTKEESKKSLSELLQIDPNLLKIEGKDSEEKDSDKTDKELEEKDPDKSDKEDSEDSEDADKNELEDLIQSTLEYLIKPEQDELWDLIAEFGGKIEDYDAMEELKQLVDAFLVGEFYEGELILPKIHDIVRQLESSDMPKTKVLRLKMLINDINRNRYRVKSILTRLNEAEEDEHFTTILKGLAQEGIISPEEYDEILKVGTLPDIVEIIKDTKIGEGMRFFPR